MNTKIKLNTFSPENLKFNLEPRRLICSVFV